MKSVSLRLSLSVVAVTAVLFAASCKSSRQKLPAIRDSHSKDLKSYVGEYVNSPEMIPREQSLPERIELLRNNWAMKEAAENGKMNIRMIAPPLQLSGDVSLDMSRTYNVLLAADDLQPNESFLDVYEVRVGPPSILTTVRPAEAAESLAEADLVQAEEHLTRLRLDKQTLLSDLAFNTNYAAAASNRLTEAGAGYTNQLNRLEAMRGTLLGQLAGNSNELSGLTNCISRLSDHIKAVSLQLRQVAVAAPNPPARPNPTATNAAPANPAASTNAVTDTNAVASADTAAGTNTVANTNAPAEVVGCTLADTAGITDTNTLKKILEDDSALLAAKRRQQEEFTRQGNDLRAKVARADVLKEEQTARFESFEQQVQGFLQRRDILSAHVQAVDVMENYWRELLTSAQEISGFSREVNVYPMRTAATVSFRAASLKGLSQISIDVIRKNTGQIPPNPNQPKKDASKLSAQLKEVTAHLPRLTSRLLMDDETADYDGRLKQIQVELIRLQNDMGQLRAQLVLAEAGDKAFASTNVLHRMLWTNLTAVISGRNAGSGSIADQVEELADALQDKKVLRGKEKTEVVKDLAALSGSLSQAVSLAELWEKALGIAPEESGPGDDVQKILSGNKAVFQLNVLRGVVSTTAFLLADDGAAQMFGRSFASEFYAAQVTFRNTEDKPILIYGNTMRMVVRMNAVNFDSLSPDGEFNRDFWWATYEPLDYDSIRRMVESQQENSWQKWISKTLDVAQMGGGAWAAFGPSAGVLKGISLFGAFTPKLKDLLEADLKRNALNFREKGLNNIEEIAAQGTLTRYVFLPKGPIYGNVGIDVAEANGLPQKVSRSVWTPFTRESKDFGKRALIPAYIHDIRHEEVYVEGKRILSSDPLTSTGAK